jgi:uncharacterized membrane protein YvbJ
VNSLIIQGSKDMEINTTIKKKKSPLLSIITVTGMLILFFSISTLMASKEKSLAMFVEAIEQKDVKQLQQLLISEDPKLEMSAENVKLLLNFIHGPHSDKEYKQHLFDALSHEKEHHLIAIQAKEKLLFFEEYKFVVKPYYFNFNVDEYVKEIEIVGMEKIKIDSTNKKIVRSGPLMPTTYDIIFTHQSSYGESNVFTLNTNLKVSHAFANDKNEMQSTKKTKFVTISESYNNILEGGTLFINGEETELKFKNDIKLFALPLDGTVEIVVKKQFPWGMYVSEPTTVNSTSVKLYLDVTADYDLKDEILIEAQKFTDELVQAWEKKDLSALNGINPHFHERLTVVLSSFEKYRGSVKNFTNGRLIDFIMVSQEEAEKYNIPFKEGEKIYAARTMFVINGVKYSEFLIKLYYNPTSDKWIPYSDNY